MLFTYGGFRTRDEWIDHLITERYVGDVKYATFPKQTWTERRWFTYQKQDPKLIAASTLHMINVREIKEVTDEVITNMALRDMRTRYSLHDLTPENIESIPLLKKLYDEAVQNTKDAMNSIENGTSIEEMIKALVEDTRYAA